MRHPIIRVNGAGSRPREFTILDRAERGDLPQFILNDSIAPRLITEWVGIPREGFENVPGPQARTLSEKRLPSLRITPEVHHGNDQDFVLLDVINQAKRKSVCPAAASPPREHSPRFGCGKNSGHRSFDFIKELSAARFRRFHNTTPLRGVPEAQPW